MIRKVTRPLKLIRFFGHVVPKSTETWVLEILPHLKQ
jgi:hypothetical protein